MDIFGQKNPTDSPCIGICSTSFGDEVCVGCGRTFSEVCRWNTMTDEEKTQVNHRLCEARQKAEKTNTNNIPVVFQEANI